MIARELPTASHDVGGQCQVQHLLFDDVDQRGLLGLYPARLLRREPLVGCALQGELRVQVLAHQAMLDLAGLAEQVDMLFPLSICNGGSAVIVISIRSYPGRPRDAR
jgi:hypothetical protein